MYFKLAQFGLFSTLVTKLLKFIELPSKLWGETHKNRNNNYIVRDNPMVKMRSCDRDVTCSNFTKCLYRFKSVISSFSSVVYMSYMVCRLLYMNMRFTHWALLIVSAGSHDTKKIKKITYSCSRHKVWLAGSILPWPKKRRPPDASGKIKAPDTCTFNCLYIYRLWWESFLL